jgi:adenine-specific DNA-methyltransferase
MARTLAATETLRQQEQLRLDSVKSSNERNKLGQFATPPELAVDIAQCVHRLWRDRRDKYRMIEPAVGTGAFISAVRRTFSSEQHGSILGVELDRAFCDVATSLWGSRSTEIAQADFTRMKPSNKPFSLLISNPPYVRHHHLTTDEKGRLAQTVMDTLGIRISRLAGLYCYFVLLAHRWLTDDAISVWLIPSEFMDVNYGTALREYLTRNVTLLRIHRFCPSDVQFADALVSSAVVIFTKRPPLQEHKALFSFGGSLERPTQSQDVAICDLRSTTKWTCYPTSKPNHYSPDALYLSDLFSIKRGLATGANDFFILLRTEAARLGLSPDCLRPILPSPRYLQNAIVEADADGYPALDKQHCLLDCRYDVDHIRQHLPDVWHYLREGMKKGIHEGYLASHRKLWYQQEDRPPAPFLCTYMGRGQNGAAPFRFIWNKSAATATNVYLLLYPKGNLKSLLDAASESRFAKVFQLLQELDTRSHVSEGRVYGGGLHKMEPKELGRWPANHFAKKLEGLSFDRQLALSL